MMCVFSARLAIATVAFKDLPNETVILCRESAEKSLVSPQMIAQCIAVSIDCTVRTPYIETFLSLSSVSGEQSTS